MRLDVDIEHRYRNGPTISARFVVELAPGRPCALLGPSGAGKTTILRAIAGLERPHRGHIRVDDETWFDHARQQCLPPQARRTGLIFQDYALYPHLTVHGNVLLPARLTTDSRSEAEQRVRQLLQMVGLWDERHRYPHQLSGGQQQRLALARALACDARLLLLDEPFAALDQLTRRTVRQQLLRLVAQSGVPVLLVGHEWSEIAADADHVIVMHEGRVVATGRPDQLADRPPCRLVAQLVGYTNVFAVTGVRPADSGKASIDLGGVELQTRDTLCYAEPVWCCVHPEAIRAVDDGQDINVLSGTIESIEAAVRPACVTVREGERSWRLHVPVTFARSLRPGQRMRFRVPEDAVRLVPERCPEAEIGTSGLPASAD